VLPLKIINATGPAIGLFVILPSGDMAAALKDQTKYLAGVAQCFRGLIMFVGQDAIKKRAEPQAA
jgi:hypothetical protein